MHKHFDLKFTCNFVYFYLKTFFFLLCTSLSLSIGKLWWLFIVFSEFIVSKEKSRGVSRTAAKSKLEFFVTKVNGWKRLTFVTKSSILDFVVVSDTLLKGTLLIIWAFYSKTNYRTKNRTFCLRTYVFFSRTRNFSFSFENWVWTFICTHCL